MPQGYGPASHAVLDELVAIHIPDVTSLTAGNEAGCQ